MDIENQYTALQREYDEFVESSHALEGALELEVNNLGTHNRRLQLEIGERTREVEALAKRLLDQEEKLERSIWKSEEESKQLKIKVRDLENRNDDLENDARASISVVADLRSKLENTAAAVEFAEQQIEILKDALRTADDEVRDMKDDIRIKDMKLKTMNNVTTPSRIPAPSGQLQKLRESLEFSTTQVNDLRSVLLTKDAKILELSKYTEEEGSSLKPQDSGSDNLVALERKYAEEIMGLKVMLRSKDAKILELSKYNEEPSMIPKPKLTKNGLKNEESENVLERKLVEMNEELADTKLINKNLRKNLDIAVESYDMEKIHFEETIALLQEELSNSKGSDEELNSLKVKLQESMLAKAQLKSRVYALEKSDIDRELLEQEIATISEEFAVFRITAETKINSLEQKELIVQQEQEVSNKKEKAAIESGLESTIDSMEAEIISLRRLYEEKETQHRNMQQKLDQFSTEAPVLQQRLQDTIDELAQAQEQIQKASTWKTEMLEQQSTMLTSESELGSEINQLESKLSQSRDDFEIELRSKSELKSKVELLESQLAQYIDDIESALKCNKDLESALTTSEESLQLERDIHLKLIARSKETEDSMQMEFITKQTDLEKVLIQLDESSDKYNALIDERDQLDMQLQIMDSRLKEIQTEFITKQADIDLMFQQKSEASNKYIVLLDEKNQLDMQLQIKDSRVQELERSMHEIVQHRDLLKKQNEKDPRMFEIVQNSNDQLNEQLVLMNKLHENVSLEKTEKVAEIELLRDALNALKVSVEAENRLLRSSSEANEESYRHTAEEKAALLKNNSDTIASLQNQLAVTVSNTETALNDRLVLEKSLLQEKDDLERQLAKSRETNQLIEENHERMVVGLRDQLQSIEKRLNEALVMKGIFDDKHQLLLEKCELMERGNASLNESLDQQTNSIKILMEEAAILETLKISFESNSKADVEAKSIQVQKNADALATIARVEKEKIILEEEYETLAAKVSSLENDKSQLEIILKSESDEKLMLDEQNQLFLDDISKLRQLQEDLQESLKEQSNMKSILREENASLIENVSNLESNISVLEKRIADVVDELSIQKETSVTQEEEMGDLELRIHNSTSRQTELEQQVESMQSQMGILQGEREHIICSFESLESGEFKEKSAIACVDGLLTKYQAQVQEIDVLKSEFEKRNFEPEVEDEADRLADLETQVFLLRATVQELHDAKTDLAIQLREERQTCDEVRWTLEHHTTTTQASQLQKAYAHQIRANNRMLSRLQKIRGNILVCCRIRPLLGAEIGQKEAVEALNSDEMTFFHDRSEQWVPFAFDRVFDSSTSQRDVCRNICDIGIPEAIVGGSNGCIMAYGQTGSGKTYTMDGPEKDSGINYQTIRNVYELLDAQHHPFSVHLAMVEIYNEQVRDLLHRDNSRSTSPPKVGRNKLTAQNTDEFTWVDCKTMGMVDGVLSNGRAARATASTQSNSKSSRSHLIIIVKVACGSEDALVISSLYLVDLAGSERPSKSKVQGERMDETKSINRSLAALGDVMAALDSKDRSRHVPYRNSKLTHVLQPVLQDNSRTVMILNVASSEKNSGETHFSLQFGARARNIELGAAKHVVEVRNTVSEIQRLKEKVAELQGGLKKSGGKQIHTKGGQRSMEDCIGREFAESRRKIASVNKFKSSLSFEAKKAKVELESVKSANEKYQRRVQQVASLPSCDSNWPAASAPSPLKGPSGIPKPRR